MTSSSPQNLVTDTWVKASWEEFIALAANPAYEKGRFYYHQGYIRIEILPISFCHGHYHAITLQVVSLFATLKNIRFIGSVLCSFRKAGVYEFQPELSFYIGSKFRSPPKTNSPINLLEFEPPTLVVEISSSSLDDDLGHKRSLYESSGIQEYWVVDTSTDDVIAFEISEGRSGETQESLVLPGLAIALVEEALKRSQNEDDGEINRWLLQIFSRVESDRLP